MVVQRHLNLDELLALRDGEGSAFAQSHADSCEHCRNELGRLFQVQAQLRALPTFGPPRDLWPKISDAVARRRRRRRLRFGIIGLATAAGLTGLLVLRGSTEAPPQDSWVAEAGTSDLGPMINRSRELESLLQAHRPEYNVYDAPTALAVSVLEDRILLLDRMLSEGRSLGADREVLRGLWGERVEALETLVGLELAPEGAVWR
jgi:hypothetical protein